VKIAFFASSLVSAYWNGAATYYRGLLRALAERGHEVTFYEPDAFDRQAHRDIDDPPWARVVIYRAELSGVEQAVASARGSDLVVKASGVGVFDRELEQMVLALKPALVAFWDVDAPATLQRVERDPEDPFRPLIPSFDVVFTYGGGPPVVSHYERLGARRCVPIYNALDPETHYPVAPDSTLATDLAFVGNRLPDREQRVDAFFLHAAELAPDRRFLLGGAGWADKPRPANVRYLGHVYTRDHNAINCSALAVLNVSRESMAAYGYSPATRVFEAAGAGACVITDAWPGIEQFLEPGREVLVAGTGAGVAELVAGLSVERAHEIGFRARQRLLSQHTYAHRAIDVERALGERGRPRRPRTLSIDLRTACGSAARSASAELSIAMLGLSITSSWGNGHGVTYRSLVRGLTARGHDVHFLERDVPWYAAHRDLTELPGARVSLYRSVDELRDCFAPVVRDADLVIVGSYVPEGIAVGDWVLETAHGLPAFYDIDTPVTLAALEHGGCEYLTREQVARYRLYLSFTGGPTLARLERDLHSPRARALYCSVDPELYAPERRAVRWHLGYMGTYSDDRQRGVDQLLLEVARRRPDRALVLAGPKYPADIAWPQNVDRIEHVHPAQHRAFYNRLGFALNLTRRDMARAGWSPSVRLFEAAACGVPIISDAWDGLTELFEPGREILVARSTDDVLEHLGRADGRTIGARARARILASHTPQHRASMLERYVAELS
jgi:spore maturation protein CgeB